MIEENEPSENDPRNFLIRLKSRQSDSGSEWESRFDGTSLDTYGKRCNSIIMKRASNRKIRFTERTALPDGERRLNVSD